MMDGGKFFVKHILQALFEIYMTLQRKTTIIEGGYFDCLSVLHQDLSEVILMK